MSDIEVVPLCVRAARADDLDAVLAVHDLHLGRPSPRPPTERERASWDLMMNTPGATVYLGWIGGDAVGTATAVLIPSVASDGAPSVLVEAVVTVPHRRRQGIATAIMGEILADARARGCNKVQLLSHKRHAMDGAHDLYRRLGFEAEAEGFRFHL